MCMLLVVSDITRSLLDGSSRRSSSAACDRNRETDLGSDRDRRCVRERGHEPKAER
ncbi:hypothetical protein MKW98_024265, partial [Papaver atlanticum]